MEKSLAGAVVIFKVYWRDVAPAPGWAQILTVHTRSELVTDCRHVARMKRLEMHTYFKLRNPKERDNLQI
jgi:hypothetical protein